MSAPVRSWLSHTSAPRRPPTRSKNRAALRLRYTQPNCECGRCSASWWSGGVGAAWWCFWFSHTQGYHPCRTRDHSATKPFHSDRGSQYAAHSYQERLQERGIVCSMSRRGNCWDNAVGALWAGESFFATLKKEEVHRENSLTHEQAKASLFYYLEVFYNRKRRHSTLGYLSPHHYEQPLLN
jgi:transposase InsO family protein